MLATAQTRLAEGVIELGVGHPSLSMLPFEAMRQAAAHRFAQHDPSFLQYGAEWGDGHLRGELAQFLSRRYGFAVRAEELLISGGVSQAIDLACVMLTEAGDSVVVEDPTYFLSLDIFRNHGLRLLSVPVDEHGLDIAALEKLLETERPKLVYTIPTHQNPSGATLSAERRERLSELAEAHGFYLLADEVYHLLTYGDTPPPSFGSHIAGRRVISMGSFSKIVAPALRLGWIQAREDVLEKLVSNGMIQSAGGFNPLGSAMLRSMLELGLLPTYLDGLRDTFRVRAAALCEALATLPDVEFVAPQGGYFVWLKLPAGVSATQLLPIALEEGVRFQAGPRFSPLGGQENYIRLCFAYYTESDLVEGVRRLGRSLERVRG